MGSMVATSQKTFGQSYLDRLMTEAEVRAITNQFFAAYDFSGQKVLVIVPDGTRTMPMPLFFDIFFEALDGKVAQMDYLIALGTHSPMPEDAQNRLLGIAPDERHTKYKNIRIFNHQWD